MIAIIAKTLKKNFHTLMVLSTVLAIASLFKLWFDSRKTHWEAVYFIGDSDQDRLKALILLAGADHQDNKLAFDPALNKPGSKLEGSFVNMRWSLNQASVKKVDLEAMLQDFEEKILKLDQRIRQQTLHPYRQQLDLKKDQLSLAWASWDHNEGMGVDPRNGGQESTALRGTIDDLRAEATRLKAEVETKKSYMQESSATIQSLNARIRVINQLLADLGQSSLGAAESDLGQARIELRYAEDLYQEALFSYRQARQISDQGRLSLTRVNGPTLAPWYQSLSAWQVISVSMFGLLSCLSLFELFQARWQNIAGSLSLGKSDSRRHQASEGRS